MKLTIRSAVFLTAVATASASCTMVLAKDNPGKVSISANLGADKADHKDGECDKSASGETDKLPARTQDSDSCKIECIDPHPCCPESEKVIEVLKKLTTAYAHGDIKTYEEYLDDNCTTFNEGKKKLVTGKENVLSELRQKFACHAPGGSKPLKSLTIDLPYAKISPDGTTCTVTFVAIREIGGEHPATEESHSTDVFVKRGDTWKKLHYRGCWKKVAAK